MKMDIILGSFQKKTNLEIVSKNELMCLASLWLLTIPLCYYFYFLDLQVSRDGKDWKDNFLFVHLNINGLKQLNLLFTYRYWFIC
jgi:hypothetical protein